MKRLMILAVALFCAIACKEDPEYKRWKASQEKDTLTYVDVSPTPYVPDTQYIKVDQAFFLVPKVKEVDLGDGTYRKENTIVPAALNTDSVIFILQVDTAFPNLYLQYRKDQ